MTDLKIREVLEGWLLYFSRETFKPFMMTCASFVVSDALFGDDPLALQVELRVPLGPVWAHRLDTGSARRIKRAKSDDAADRIMASIAADCISGLNITAVTDLIRESQAAWGERYGRQETV